MGKGTQDNKGAFLDLEELQRVIKRAKHKAYARNRQQREIEEQASHELAKQAVCAKIQEERRENVRLRHNATALQMQQIQMAHEKNTIEQMVNDQERHANVLLEQLRKAVDQSVRSNSEPSWPSSSAKAHSRRALTLVNARSRETLNPKPYSVAPSPLLGVTERLASSWLPRDANRLTGSEANVRWLSAPMKRKSTMATARLSGRAAEMDAIQRGSANLLRSPSPPSVSATSPTTSVPRDSMSPFLCSGSGESWSADLEGGMASSSDAHLGGTLPGWPPLSLEGAQSFLAWAQPHPSETEEFRLAEWD